MFVLRSSISMIEKIFGIINKRRGRGGGGVIQTLISGVGGGRLFGTQE